MTKKSPMKQSRRHVWLFDEDWEWITAKYKGKIGPSEAVRTMVHTFVLRIKQQEQHAIEQASNAALKRQAQVGKVEDLKHV